MQILLLFAASLMLATFAPPGLQRHEPPPAVTWITFTPVDLDSRSPGSKRLGRLEFLGGWTLTSNDLRVGGISALHVEGDEALALSDAGWRIRFPLPAGRGPVRARIARIEQGPGPGSEKQDRDVESLAVHGGRAWIGFEQANQIWRYDRAGFRRQSSAAPAPMSKWRDNGGAEAMVRLGDGRFLVFEEGPGGDSDALLFDGDPARSGTTARRLRYRPPDGYRITDAALLPDGRLLLLNRRVSILEGFTARLVLASLPAINGIIHGEEVAAFDAGVTRDNLEGLSVTREGARTILWIASDDNYNPLQRTLLMKFAWIGA